MLFRYTYAVRLLGVAEYEAAVQQFDIVIRVLPDFPLAYHGRGLAFYNDEHLELALEDFNKAIELKSDFAEAYRNRGVLHLNKGSIREGIADLEKALSLFQEQGNNPMADDVRQILEGG